MNKQPEATKQTKENLKKAFWTLYTQKGIEKITVKEVVNLAGYNRTTFYLYYQDLYDLLEQIENEVIDHIDSALNDYRIDKIEETLPALMNIFTESLLAYSEIVSALMSEHGDPKFSLRLKETIWPFLMKWLLPETNYDEYEMNLLSEFYLSGLIALINKWNQDNQMSVQELVAFILPIVFPNIPNE